MRRLLLPVLVVVACAAAWTPSAFSASCPDPQSDTLSSTHFVLEFDSGSASDHKITALQAGSVLADAERAYDAYAGLGFSSPLTDGTGKTEIDVDNLTADKTPAEYCSGAFLLDSKTAVTGDQSQSYLVSFAVFAEIALRYGGFGDWVTQGMASWAAWKSLGYPTQSTSDLGPWGMSLDCLGSSLDQFCSAVSYENLGGSRWPFYEYLAEHFGNAFMSEVLTDGVSGGSVVGLNTALGAHATSFAAEYGAFTTKLMKGGWSAQPLNLALPPLSGQPVTAGVQTGDLPAQTFGVDHMATRFVQIDRGDGSAEHKCYAATLTLNVAIPSGITSQPVFYWAAAGSSPVPLTISGSNATATLPWDTCKWSTHGYLSLPNTSTTTNGSNFVVSGHLAVTTTEVTATPPSVPANGYGNSTDVATAATAPLISVFGPLLLTLPSTAGRIQVVVQSNLEGTLHGMLGSLDLGLQPLVPGTNDVRFSLPAGALQRVRRSAAAAPTLLTLTPVSADGKASGTAVVVKVAIQPAAKHPKTKKKKSHSK